eukprot:PITA_01735
MSCVPYASAVNSMMYAMVCTRPDIAHAMGVLSRFMSKPRKEHWTAVKWVFRYLRGTSDLWFVLSNKTMIGQSVGYSWLVDANWAGDLIRKDLQVGMCFKLFGGAVSWMSKKQSLVALSTTEAEYMATTHASKEAVWLQRLCSSNFCTGLKPTQGNKVMEKNESGKTLDRALKGQFNALTKLDMWHKMLDSCHMGAKSISTSNVIMARRVNNEWRPSLP